MKKFIRSTLCLAFIATLSGMSQYYGPLGNGTLEHEDDLKWVFFHDAKVIADNAKGVYRATFSPSLAAMDGKPFTITGYMLTVEPTTHSAHFVITRRSTGCPFCPPNEPNEAIEVFGLKATDYTQSPITVEGQLRFVTASADGLFFQLKNARVL